MIDFYDPYDLTPDYDPYKGMSDEERIMLCVVQLIAGMTVIIGGPIIAALYAWISR